MSLLRLAIVCRRCGRRPNWRIFPVERDLHADLPPDESVTTWQCQGCGETHVVTARAYKEAAA